MAAKTHREWQSAETEEEYQRKILWYAHLNGWRVAHFRPGRTAKGWRTPIAGDAGYPDLTLVRDGRLIFAELKAQRGRIAPAQSIWLKALRAAAQEVYVWRPSDWEQVVEILRR